MNFLDRPISLFLKKKQHQVDEQRDGFYNDKTLVDFGSRILKISPLFEQKQTFILTGYLVNN